MQQLWKHIHISLMHLTTLSLRKKPNLWFKTDPKDESLYYNDILNIISLGKSNLKLTWTDLKPAHALILLWKKQTAVVH